jgi:hypothetical protein
MTIVLRAISSLFKEGLITKLLLLIAVILLIDYCLNKTNPHLNKTTKRQLKSSGFFYYEFTSHCPCRNETIRLVKFDNQNYTVVKIKNNEEFFMYNISVAEMQKSRFTCDMFNTLRRGKGLKLQSFSLFGERKPFYYDKFINNSQMLGTLFPGWLMRVLHDDTIDRSIICEVECAKDDQGNYLNNVDFCDVTVMPENGLNASLVWSALYMHPMKYRWLPVGDSFVDVTTSRDSDGVLIEREVHAVKEWFNSGKYSHIMRDHKGHTVRVLGGTWGVYNARNRQKSETIYNLIKNPEIAQNYHRKGQPMQKGNDQDFLGQHVYQEMITDSIVHDSFFCMIYGGQPFPTKRNGDCYIGNAGICDPVNGNFQLICPLQCRPKDHQGTFF